MRFFFDRNFSIRVAKMIAAYSEGDHEIVHLDEDQRFVKGTDDITWLNRPAQDDPPWAVITIDRGILSNPVERSVLSEVNITFVYLTRQWAKMGFADLAANFVKVWPKIVERVSAKETPTIFKVHAGRQFEVEEIGPTRRPGKRS